MRFVEITHTYVLAVPAEDVDAIDAIANEGVSIMEGFMSLKAKNIRELHSSWALMPREYSPRPTAHELALPDEVTITHAQLEQLKRLPARQQDIDEAKYAIENDLDQGISFTGDIMGQNLARVTHPWDQGLSIFPEDHPLRGYEDAARKGDADAMKVLEDARKQLDA